MLSMFHHDFWPYWDSVQLAVEETNNVILRSYRMIKGLGVAGDRRKHEVILNGVLLNLKEIATRLQAKAGNSGKFKWKPHHLAKLNAFTCNYDMR
tara:strand:+ start:315 stop:599 length:285 start_codon:yes stop_codon:yes gene_type:complete